MKKIISIILALVMMLSISCIGASAVDYKSDFEENARVTELNGIRTVTTSDQEKEYTVVYDQINQIITFTEKDIETGTYSTASASVSETLWKIADTRAVAIEQDTESGFLYRKETGKPNQWRLERPKLKDEGTGRFYFKCKENSSNKTELGDFESSVNTLAKDEATLESKAGTAKTSSFITGVLAGFAAGTGGTLAPAAISALLITINFTKDAEAAAKVVAAQCNMCMSDYFEVFNNSDNISY